MSTLNTTWKGLKHGQGHIEGGAFSIPIAIPERFGGIGGGANPKDMLKGSAASCLVMTLAIMLESRNVKTEDIHISTVLTGDTPQNLLVAHSVTVSLPEGTNQEQADKAMRLINAADDACMIGNLLKAAGVKVTVSGDVSLKKHGI
ncbi:OsmC family protein [Cronobacter sakazakii]